MFGLDVLIAFVVSLIKGVLGEYSRDKAQQVSGEVATENKIIEAAGERAKDAAKNAEVIAELSDDDLDNLMRRNRDANTAGKAGTEKAGSDN